MNAYRQLFLLCTNGILRITPGITSQNQAERRITLTTIVTTTAIILPFFCLALLIFLKVHFPSHFASQPASTRYLNQMTSNQKGREEIGSELRTPTFKTIRE